MAVAMVVVIVMRVEAQEVGTTKIAITTLLSEATTITTTLCYAA